MPLVPILGIAFNGYMMYKLGWINWARLIVWLIIGLVVYFTYSRHHSHLAKDRNAANGKADFGFHAAVPYLRGSARRGASPAAANPSPMVEHTRRTCA